MRTLSAVTICLLLLTLPAWSAQDSNLSKPDADQKQMTDLAAAAEHGDAGAQYLLGFMYAEGQGVPQDYTQAIRWYTKAAEQGHPDAPFMLAALCTDGRGIPPDPGEALRWYLTAARQGQPDAQLIASDMIAGGEGTEADLVEACKWALLAQQGGKDVTESMARLTERMTPEQIAEAHNRADELAASLPAPIGETGPIQYISQTDGFTVRFPAPPVRTVVQDDARLTAVHCQSISPDGRVQYNVSLQRFKDRKFLDPPAQKRFFEDYLITRAFFSWKSKILKKYTDFHGLPAVRFKHTTRAEGKYTIHEGMAFFTPDGDFVSLTCVYPSDAFPSSGFREYLDSFNWTTPKTK